MSAADDGRSLGELVAAATTELSALVHDEIALAKAEVKQDVKRGAIGSGALIVALVLILFSLPVLSFAAAYGIHNLGLGLAWSFLIVGGAFIVLAALLGLVAKIILKRIEPPKKTMESARETAMVLSKVKPHPRAAQNGGVSRRGTAAQREEQAQGTRRTVDMDKPAV
ncbi:phage holin family protein [Streptomyces sp. N2-109]|uniref:Phage holin family protein n=1 Tax=Streptomyces gossypii TaxID=2883101 RepID=A0ABT2JPV5_9ACTN|nr:phage holin family protein [Streptomyces gossypii]MCT2589904.1 phage holin family protein [Streptomyces gossypii]